MRSDEELELAAESAVDAQFGIEQTSAFSHSGHERNHVFWNRGGGEFHDISGISGLDDPADGRAWARWDFDRDGWQDAAVVNANGPRLRLYRNRIGDRPEADLDGNFIALRFVGGNTTDQPDERWTSRDGYGARVRWRHLNKQFIREHRAGEGMATQNSSTMLIGIGPGLGVTDLAIEWPSGRSQSMSTANAGDLITVYENPADSPRGTGFDFEPYRRPAAVTLRLDETLHKGSPIASFEKAMAGDGADLVLFTTMATWCPKCKGELPQLAALREQFSASRLALRAVPIDPEDSDEMLAEYRATYTPAYEMALAWTPSERAAFKRQVMEITGFPEVLPATVVTDSRGRVLWSGAGVPSVSEIRELIQKSGLDR